MSKPVKKLEERPPPKPIVLVADIADSVQAGIFEIVAKLWKGPEV